MTAPAVAVANTHVVPWRSKVYPGPGADPKLIVAYIHKLWEDQETEALERYRKSTENLLFSDGRQWIEWTTRDRMWKNARTIEGRKQITMNYIRPILRARINRLLSPPRSWNIRPPSNAHEDHDKKLVGEALFERRWEMTDMDAKARLALWLASCCGVAYWKQFWNEDLGTVKPATIMMRDPETGQIVEIPVDRDGNAVENPDDAFQVRLGDTDTAVRSVFNVRLNPGAQSLRSADGFRWLIDADVVPLEVIRQRWQDRGIVNSTKVQVSDRHQSLRQYEKIVRSIQQRQLGSLDAQRDRTVPDRETAVEMQYWEDPTPAQPEGRLIVVAGDELMYDDVWPQGILPYVDVLDEIRPFDAAGRPMVDDLVPPQKVINNQWSLIHEEEARSGIGQWISWDIPGIPDQITSVPDAITKIPKRQGALGARSIHDVIQRLGPTRISETKWRLIELSMRAMFDIGAFHEIQRGQVPPGVESGVAIRALDEAEQGQLGDPIRNLKRAYKLWAKHTLAIARWGYGEQMERFLPVNRPDLGFLVQDVSGSDLPDPNTVSIDLDGFRPRNQAAFEQQVETYMEKQWIDPRQGMKLIDMGRGLEGAFESQNRHYARARAENLAIEQGQFVQITHPEGSPLEGYPAFMNPDGSPFLLPSDDDHLVHIETHHEVALDNSKPWPVRQAVILHITEHRTILQQQALQAAALEAEQAGNTSGKAS